MQLIAGIIIGLLLILIGPLLLIFSIRWFKTDDVSDRIQEYSAPKDTMGKQMTADLNSERIDITGSFLDRTIAPLFRRFAKLIGQLTPWQMLEAQEHKLILAGQPLNMGAREFYGLRFIILILGLGLAILLLRTQIEPRTLLGAALILFLCVLLPIAWLSRKIRKRQTEILRSLPDALDMLSVCATAGLGFDQSLQRVSEYWQTTMGIEFGRVISEMEMGLSRSAALRNLSERTDVSQLSSFVSLIIQAEKLGMSITNTVTAMADQMRIERRFRAQEEARKLPNKMLFPLTFFMFPAMIAIILGPSIPAMLDLFQFIG